MTLLWPIIVLYWSTHRDTHACAFTLICILAHPFLNSHKHACTHTFMDAHQCAHTDICTHMHMYVHAHIHSCTVHMHMTSHTCTYTRTHAGFAPVQFLTLLAFLHRGLPKGDQDYGQRSVPVHGAAESLCFSLWERLFFPSPCPQLASAYYILQQGGSTGYFSKDQISGAEWGGAEGITSCLLCCTIVELTPDWIPQ